MSGGGKMFSCPHCGYELWPSRTVVQYVLPDGCQRRGPGGNVRTRDHVGNDRDGSFRDEMARGVRTPWSSRQAKENALAALVDDNEREFAASLPYVRDPDDPDAD